jgi:hypothetical protein
MDGQNALRGTHIEPILASTCFVHTNLPVPARTADSNAPKFQISHRETNPGSGKT